LIGFSFWGRRFSSPSLATKEATSLHFDSCSFRMLAMSMHIREALDTGDTDLRVIEFWSLCDSEKAEVLEEVLAIRTSFKPTLERHIIDVHSRGSRADWVKRIYPTLIPVGMSRSEVADFLGIDETKVWRAEHYGELTLEQLGALSQLKPDVTALPLPPPRAGFLGGMARVVPWTQNFIDKLRDPESRTYRAQDDLTYQDVTFLETLINDDGNLTRWLAGIARAGDDRRSLARNPRIHTVLASCLSEASASLKTNSTDEAPFAFDLKSPERTDRFCNYLINLWNRMQAGWVVANEVISRRLP
jgi:hypothetical protein